MTVAAVCSKEVILFVVSLFVWFDVSRPSQELRSVHLTTVKPVLIDKTKVLKTNGSLMKVEKYWRMLSWNGLEIQFLIFIEWPLKTGFTAHFFPGQA